MATTTNETKPKKRKRLSKGWRMHVRRMKQEAHKAGADQKQPARTPRAPVEAKQKPEV